MWFCKPKWFSDKKKRNTLSRATQIRTHICVCSYIENEHLHSIASFYFVRLFFVTFFLGFAIFSPCHQFCSSFWLRILARRFHFVRLTTKKKSVDQINTFISMHSECASISRSTIFSALFLVTFSYMYLRLSPFAQTKHNKILLNFYTNDSVSVFSLFLLSQAFASRWFCLVSTFIHFLFYILWIFFVRFCFFVYFNSVTVAVDGKYVVVIYSSPSLLILCYLLFRSRSRSLSVCFFFAYVHIMWMAKWKDSVQLFVLCKTDINIPKPLRMRAKEEKKYEQRIKEKKKTEKAKQMDTPFCRYIGKLQSEKSFLIIRLLIRSFLFCSRQFSQAQLMIIVLTHASFSIPFLPYVASLFFWIFVRSYYRTFAHNDDKH